MKNFLLVLGTFFLFQINTTTAQTLTQTIRGNVIDVDTREPLIGAQITVENLEDGAMLGAVTDVDGNYVIENVPVGRRTLSCSYIGYSKSTRDNINLNSAREYVVDFVMKAGLDMEELVIEGDYQRNEAVNELAVVSIRRLDPDELQYHAATANDPSRLVMGFPGVQPNWDVRNEVIVRGNSAIGVLWRLEGIDIPNPNHYAFAGSSGGGVSIFSASMLGSSDFSTGAFTAEYGNATSGVFDMNFRNGNMYKREHTFRIGILGLDYSTEGPIKEGKSSYLTNFRYSTLGILNQFGIHLVGPRNDNNFYDLSFKIHHKGKKSQFSLWGIGGSSVQTRRAADTLRFFSEYFVSDWRTEMGVVGATWNYLIDDKSYIRSNVAITGQRLYSEDDTISLTTGELGRIATEDIVNSQISTNTFYKRTFSNQFNMKAGAILTRYNYKMSYENMDFTDSLITAYDIEGGTSMMQPYVQFSYRPTKQLMINFGAHAMFLALNGTSSIEPRFAIRYQINPISNIAFSYGLHSHTVPWDIYFVNDDGAYPNINLELMKSHHFILAYDQAIGKSWRVHAETYYQALYDVPVIDDPERKFWLLNRISGIVHEPMISEGTGTNYGLDLTIEKFFDAGTFFVLSGSLFSSTFQVPNDDTQYNSRFNARRTANFTGGRTWKINDNSALETSLRLIYSAGNPVLPLVAGTETIPMRRPIRDYTNPFVGSVGTYFRPDIRFAYRWNKANSAYWLALDIQNFINRGNLDAYEFDYNEEEFVWKHRVQAGLTPIITFWMDF